MSSAVGLLSGGVVLGLSVAAPLGPVNLEKTEGLPVDVVFTYPD